MHIGKEGHAQPGWTISRRGQDSLWKSQSEWQRTGINGESTSMVWPTLELRTAKEQNRRQPGFIFWYTLFCIGIHAPLDLLVHILLYIRFFSAVLLHWEECLWTGHFLCGTGCKSNLNLFSQTGFYLTTDFVLSFFCVRCTLGSLFII